MPKAPSASSSGASTSSGPSARPALRRNQACRQCRKRKLKCDANKPHCTTCLKQWQASISVPAPLGYVHPTEPPCNYDPIEGLALAPEADPMERIRSLEEQIVQLKTLLNDNANNPRASSPTQLLQARRALEVSFPQSHDNSGNLLHLPSLSPIIASQNGSSYGGHPSSSLAPSSARPGGSSNSPEPFLDLLHMGWNTDLPDPNVLHHLVDVFFRCDPCGSRILHRPSFMASLQLHPKDPNFPHNALLHAICASASRWVSHDVVSGQDGSRRDPFAEYHTSKTRQYIDRTMATGHDIFAVLQACILLSWYFYSDGRWVEVWIFAGFQTRVAVPLRLNYPGTYTTQGRQAPGAYLPPPKDPQELEARRRTWWMTVMFDRIVSVGGWLHSIDERDIGTEFPQRTDDFWAGHILPTNPQDITSKDMLLIHPPAYTDSLTLFMKTCLLFGKVTDYNVRNSLRSKEPVSSSQDPFHLPGFRELDQLVCVDFLRHIPSTYIQDYGLDSGGGLDTDAYMVQIMPHAATITLHTHYMNFADPQSVSTARCTYAAQSILQAYYVISGTSVDISRLHPFVTICWYLAAVVQIHMCKYLIEMGNVEREAHIWGEINLLRFAMLEYGNRSPIGIRQEKLLQGMMAEIVKMTSQKQPLQVGLPLYPFSHASAFARNETPSTDGSSPGNIAPLPISPAFETTGPKAPAPRTLSPSPRMPAAAWSTNISAPVIADRR